jgi:hypothetical protein
MSNQAEIGSIEYPCAMTTAAQSVTGGIQHFTKEGYVSIFL